MEQLSLFDKFKVLFENIFQHPLFTILLLVPVIIFLLQRKHGKKAFIFVYLLVIIFVLFIGGEVIFELFDNLMDGLFMTLYFPNFITLFIVVVLCSLIALFSFFSKRMFRVNKVINIVAFAIIQMLFVLILTLVKSKNINIYADNALYSNGDVLTLMQLLIGTFSLQVIAIFIINCINKVTDILDKRTTTLGENINEEVKNLKETKKSKFKSVDIDNNKIGYINVADKKNTSRPKLKPFKFDVDKLESITINAPILENISYSDKKDLVKESVISLKDESLNDFKKIKPRAEERKVLLPLERSKPKPSNKPDLYKPIESDYSKNKTITGKTLKPVKKFINEENDNFIKVISEVSKPKLVKPLSEERESIDLVDNLNILDIQSTLDTVINYKLMKWVNLNVISEENLAVDNLQIPDFDHLVLVFKKFKLYKGKMRF